MIKLSQQSMLYHNQAYNKEFRMKNLIKWILKKRVSLGTYHYGYLRTNKIYDQKMNYIIREKIQIKIRTKV